MDSLSDKYILCWVENIRGCYLPNTIKEFAQLNMTNWRIWEEKKLKLENLTKISHFQAYSKQRLTLNSPVLLIYFP